MRRATIGTNRRAPNALSLHPQQNFDEYDKAQILISGGWPPAGRENFI
jgi:hypothetical protein